MHRSLSKQGKTLVMGILNVTPDSFSDGGRWSDEALVVQRAKDMVREGADIIDIGGESTRPGASPVPLDEELRRVVPTVRALRQHLGPDIQISVDTNKSGVASAAIQAGADMLNCCGGLEADLELVRVVGPYPIVIYHRPTPEYPGTSFQEVLDFFQRNIDIGMACGLQREQFIIDPGFGFGKSLDEHVDIMRRIEALQTFDLPLLIGVSRKSHLSKLIPEHPGTGFQGRLEAGIAEAAAAVWQGASIVRTHDVRETKAFFSAFDHFIPHHQHSHERHHPCP